MRSCPPLRSQQHSNNAISYFNICVKDKTSALLLLCNFCEHPFMLSISVVFVLNKEKTRMIPWGCRLCWLDWVLVYWTDTHKKCQPETQLVHKWFSKNSTLTKHEKIYLKEGCVWFAEMLDFPQEVPYFWCNIGWASQRKTDSYF